jgi:hypothetical protein
MSPVSEHITFNSGEAITCISGTYISEIQHLKITTNQGRCFQFGSNTFGSPFILQSTNLVVRLIKFGLGKSLHFVGAKFGPLAFNSPSNPGMQQQFMMSTPQMMSNPMMPNQPMGMMSTPYMQSTPQMGMGMNSGMNMGMNSGMNMGMNPGMNMGMNTGMNMGMNPGMNMGMGMNMVMEPGKSAMGGNILLDTVHFDDSLSIKALVMSGMRPHIKRIKVFHDAKTIYGIEIDYDIYKDHTYLHHHKTFKEIHKGNQTPHSCKTHEVTLKHHEHITAITGKSTNIIHHLCIFTTNGLVVNAGGPYGNDFSLNIPPGRVIYAFSGGVGGHLHYLCAHYI